MKKNAIQKLFIFILALTMTVTPVTAKAQDAEMTAGLFDESLQDLYVVLGSGAAGAILGLSTLSFVETPKDHLKNIAVGGAIGIVFGVGIVIFNQANKTQGYMNTSYSTINGPEDVERFARIDFAKEKIAESYMQIPTVGWNFSF